MLEPATEVRPVRSEPDWVPPVPREVRAYHALIPQLDVGKPGKVGQLDLTFGVRAGRTRLAQSFSQVPLQVHRTHYLDHHLPGMAFNYIISAGGGVLQGDRLRIQANAGPGAQVHLTTQAATKVYRMSHDYAVQVVDLHVGADALLEWIPDSLIPYQSARLYQEVNLHVAPSGTLLYWDILLPGREGERFAYDVIYNRVTGFRDDGGKLFSDALCLEPALRPLDAPGVLGQYPVMGTFYALTTRVGAHELADALQRAGASQSDDVAIGASSLPGKAGVMVRVLSHGSGRAYQVLRAVWDEARRQLFGCPAPDQRKF